MQHDVFQLIFFLSLIFFIFYFYRHTVAAATLVAFLIKYRGYNLIKYESHFLLRNLLYPSLFAMCAKRARSPENLIYKCLGFVLFCSRSLKLGVQFLINWCYYHCEYRFKTQVMHNYHTTDLDHKPVWDLDNFSNKIVKRWLELGSPNPQTLHSGNHLSGNT